MAKPNQKIEQWQLEDAERLTAIFKVKSRLNQTEFGAQHKIGSQGMVWQYLSGRRPLNIKAAKAFATGLDVQIDEFSPAIASQIANASAHIDRPEESDHVPIHMVDAKASAGEGKIVFSDDSKKLLMFRRDYLAKNDAKQDDVIAFEVDGWSMTDMHIPHGSVVLANRGRRDPISKRVYVVWIDDELYVKQLIKHEGMWYARSHNKERTSEFPDIPIANTDDRIVGRAFWCGFGL